MFCQSPGGKLIVGWEHHFGSLLLILLQSSLHHKMFLWLVRCLSSGIQTTSILQRGKDLWLASQPNRFKSQGQWRFTALLNCKIWFEMGQCHLKYSSSILKTQQTLNEWVHCCRYLSRGHTCGDVMSLKGNALSVGQSRTLLSPQCN